MDSNSKAPESVGDLLSRYSGAVHRPGLRTLGVRLGDQDHVRLELVAGHFGVPKATLARDLLRAALSEALSSLRFEGPDEKESFELEYDRRMIELAEAIDWEDR